jgi:hypothetical protein
MIKNCFDKTDHEDKAEDKQYKMLIIKGHFIHRKNLHFLEKCLRISVDFIDDNNIPRDIDISKYDCVYCPSSPINTKCFPNTKFIFGPHFSVFPDSNTLSQLNCDISSSVRYTTLSKWVMNFWFKHEATSNIQLIPLPFGVDSELFKDIRCLKERNQVFVYCKSRSEDEYEYVFQFLRDQNISFKVFDYQYKYDENEYLECLQNAIFGIWIDAHESQGFALLEALSCNVPLLIWNVTSLTQEKGSLYPDYPATTIPYWDERCGDFFYKKEELKEVFNHFLSKLEMFSPREYIVENISIKVCEQKWIDVIEKM